MRPEYSDYFGEEGMMQTPAEFSAMKKPVKEASSAKLPLQKKAKTSSSVFASSTNSSETRKGLPLTTGCLSGKFNPMRLSRSGQSDVSGKSFSNTDQQD